MTLYVELDVDFSMGRPVGNIKRVICRWATRNFELNFTGTHRICHTLGVLGTATT